MAVQQEEGLNNQGTINFNDFAVSIKEKYPMYKDLDNEYLAKEIIKKYPVYENQVSFDLPEVKKKEDPTASAFSDGLLESPELSDLSVSFQNNKVNQALSDVPIFRSIYSGVNSLAGGLVKQGELFIKEALPSLLKRGIIGIGPTASPANKITGNIAAALLAKSKADDKVANIFSEYGDVLLDNARIINKEVLNEAGISDEEIEKGIFGQDNIKNAAIMTGNALLQQVPQLALIYATSPTVAISLLSTSAAGQKYAEIQDDPTLTGEEKAIYSYGVGAIEGLSEYIFKGDINIVKAGAKRLFSKAGSKDLFKKELKEQLKRQSVGRASLEEGAEELVAGGGDLIIESILRGTDENWDREAAIGLADQFLIGSLAGGGVNVAARGINSYGTTKNQRERRKAKEDISALTKKRQTAEPSQVPIIDELIDERVDDLLSLQRDDLEFYQKFSKIDIDQINNLDKQIREVSKKFAVAEGDVLKSKYTSEIDDLLLAKQQIENKYTESPVTYVRDGKNVSRSKFLRDLNNATKEQLETGQWGVQNDAEVNDLLLKKFESLKVEQPVETVAPEVTEEAVTEAPAVTEEVTEEQPAVTEEAVETVAEPITTGEQVFSFVEEITPQQEDVPTGFEGKIKERDFRESEVDLQGLLNTDPDFKEFYDNFKQRYEEGEVEPEGLGLNLVVVDGELLDGYNRAATLLSEGQNKTNAFVAVETAAEPTPIETQTEQEITVNIAPFFEASIESTAEAKGLRKSPQYQKYKESLIEIANDLGLDIQVDESIGGYVNNAGTKVREISNVVTLTNANIDQASQYAALTAALAPEVQESSIAAEYTVNGAENHNGDELTIKVSDGEGTFQSLREAGIDDFTFNESNNTLTLLDIFDFSDPESDAKLDRLLNILDNKKISYEITDKKAINSRFIDSESRKQILSDGRQSAIQQRQEGTSLYQKIISAINRDANNLGITPNEYIKPSVADEITTTPKAKPKKSTPFIPEDVDSIQPQDVVGEKDNDGNNRFFARIPVKGKDFKAYFEVEVKQDGNIVRISDKSYGIGRKTLKRRLKAEPTREQTQQSDQIATTPRKRPTLTRPSSRTASEIENKQAIKPADIGKSQNVSGARFTEAQGKQINKAISNFNKFLEATGSAPIKTVFLNLDDSVSYKNAITGRKSTATKGSFIKGKSLQPTIVINVESADVTTPYHELLHAYTYSLNLDPKQIISLATTIESELSKGSKEEKQLAKQLKDFKNKYVKTQGYQTKDLLQAEEFLAEYIGKVSSFSTDVPPPIRISTANKLKNAIIKFLAKFNIVSKDLVGAIQSREDAADFIKGFFDVVQGRVDLNNVSREQITQEQGEAGEVSQIEIKEQIDSKEAPKASEDSREFIKDVVEDVDVKELNGKLFVTNMYDYTTAGTVDLGNGLSIQLFGGKSYVPFMMARNGKKVGEVSNLAAFNTKEQAEGFIRNVKGGKSNLFAPHSGTLSESWQFQHAMLEQLTNLVLDNKILSKSELIKTFNEGLKSKDGKEALRIFNENNKSNIRTLSSFTKNPLQLVELLNAENNRSPKLRKILNQKIAANKKFQNAIGIKNLQQFYNLIADPLNKGVEGYELMSFVQFDSKTLTISKPKKTDPDYHPSFAWTIKAKIERVIQPTRFYKTYDVTDSYTKYNKDETVTSRKTDEKFAESNVTSSAGAIPKVAQVDNVENDSVIEMSQIIDENQEGIDKNILDNEVENNLAENGEWQERERTSFERFVDLKRRQFQDKFRDIIRIQEDIEFSKGEAVGLDQDFRNAEVLMHGKASQELEGLEEKLEDVVKKIKKSGLSTDQFNDLLYAMHAQERNRYLRQRSTDVGASLKKLREENNISASDFASLLGVTNEQYAEIEKSFENKLKSKQLSEALNILGKTPSQFFMENALVKNGSGMTDVEARRILSQYDLNLVNPEVSQLNKKIRPAVLAVREISKDNRDLLVERGLASESQVEAYEALYKNYVPLRGFSKEAEEFFGESNTELPSSSRIEVRGKQKRAKGRDTKADAPLTQVIVSANQSIIQGRKNETLQTLYRLLEDNPNSDLFQLIDPAKDKRFKKVQTAQGIKLISQTESDLLADETVVTVQFDGDRKFIKFADKSLAKPFKGNPATASALTRLMGRYNRLLSSLITTYNPEFIIRNFSRDIQTAVFNGIAETELEDGLIKGKKFKTGKVVKDTFTAMNAIFQAEGGLSGVKQKDRNTKFDKYWREFKEDGAKTDWFYAKPADEIAKNIEKMTEGKSKAEIGRAQFKAIGDLVERANSSVENAVRLSAYVNAREAGVSREKAAEFAKGLTVNFNKSGEYGQIANSMYLFFNASVQGTTRLLRSLASNPVTKNSEGKRSFRLSRAQKMAVGFMVMGQVMSLINQGLSDDDEDGESYYSKIADFEKERNIIIMRPKKFQKGTADDYIKIPLPYGMNVFWVAGTSIGDALQKIITPAKAVGNVLTATVGSFSPINFPNATDFSKFLAKFLIPTIGEPIVSLAVNEDYFGRKIYKENFDVGTPKPLSTLGQDKAYKWSAEITKFLNKATGGSEFRKGELDIPPEALDYIFGVVSGGAGRFVGRTTNVIEKVFSGEWEDLEANDIPLYRIVAGKPSKFANLSDFYERATLIDQFYEEYKDGQLNKADARKILRMRSLGKAYKKSLQNIRKLERAAENIKDADKRQKRMLELDEKRFNLVSAFNREYNKLEIDKIK